MNVTKTRRCDNCDEPFEAELFVDAENGPSPSDAEPQGPTRCEACEAAAMVAWQRELDEVHAEAKRRYDDGWITASERDRLVHNFMYGV